MGGAHGEVLALVAIGVPHDDDSNVAAGGERARGVERFTRVVLELAAGAERGTQALERRHDMRRPAVARAVVAEVGRGSEAADQRDPMKTSRRADGHAAIKP